MHRTKDFVKKLKHKRWMSYVHNDFLIAKCALLHLKWGLGKASVLRKLIEKLYVLTGIFRTKKS